MKTEPDFFIGQNDLLTTIEVICKDATGAVVSLATADTPEFHMAHQFTGAVVINATAEIVSPATQGMLRYSFVTPNTLVPGDYWAEFEVTFSGKPLTFPNDDRNKIWVRIGKEIA